MKLSVCVFTYNHVEYIAQTIDSILMQQTDFEYELVIGEDNSSDGTKDIIQRYQRKFPGKIKAIFNDKNKGMMQNNIDTILQCTGEYIALMDGDDYWTNPSKIQTQADFLDAFPEYAFCFHDGQILNIQGAIDNETCCGSVNKSTVTFCDVISEVSIPTHSIVFRRSAIKGYPPAWFKELNAPDRPLFLLLCDVGPGFFFKECWGVYRKHRSGTWTSQHYQSRWLTHLQIFRIMNNHFGFKYSRSFQESSSKIYYALAVDLANDKKYKRALCCLKQSIKLRPIKYPGLSLTLDNIITVVRFYSKYIITPRYFGKRSIQTPAHL